MLSFGLDRLTIYAANEKRNWQNIAATAPHFNEITPISQNSAFRHNLFDRFPDR